ncbi:hypothetical protein HAX54_033219 [Datura stramonium]|uniref:Uncharacterized protein n=1 Tax=Datura stramonium TaxID=4076 RepID=A0ABS8VFD5_DATST|nr:hypothetical protein [Datura stramonium]
MVLSYLRKRVRTSEAAEAGECLRLQRWLGPVMVTYVELACTLDSVVARRERRLFGGSLHVFLVFESDETRKEFIRVQKVLQKGKLREKGLSQQKQVIQEGIVPGIKCGKMDHLIKDCPLLKKEQRRNSKQQQQLASKAFNKAMKATWGETSDEESEVEDGDNDNLSLMAKSDTDSDSDSSEENKDEQHEIGLVPSSVEQVSAPALNEGTLLETDSSNVPSEPRQELENSGGTIPETVISLEAEIGEGTSSDPVPETQNDNPQELV